MIPIEDVQRYLPKYLSAENYKTLLNELNNFPNNLDKRMYAKGPGENVIYQGDGIKSFPFVDLQHIDKGTKIINGIVISNTCDIELTNIRLYTPSILYAPICSLDNYINMLESNKVNKNKIDNQIKDIRNQKITSIFFLPENGTISDSIVFLDRISHIDNNYIDRNQLSEQRLFSLSDYGFYLFLFKLSVHFSRIQEHINRGHL